MFSQVGRHSSHFRIVSTIPLFTLLLSTNLVVVYLLKSQKASSILKVLKKYSKEKYSLSICSLFTLLPLLLLLLQLIALFSVYTTLRTTLAGDKALLAIYVDLYDDICGFIGYNYTYIVI